MCLAEHLYMMEKEKEMSLPSFPEPGSIPPPTFYTMNGLTTWLNQNPSYKQYFINYPRYFPYLYSQSTLSEWSSMATGPFSSMFMLYTDYNIEKVPLSPLITTLSQHQAMKYREQLALFQRVYSYNSNAYVRAREGAIPAPIYYRFSSSQECMEFRTAVSFVNKLYPFDAMANGTNEYGSTLGWIVPFPMR
jgi:hypothetical protein